jgi:RNA polymerase sigma-70 factor (ECF subfamily)
MTADATKRETRLVLLAQSGDRAALEELFESIQGRRGRYVRAAAGDQSLAEDVLQEVFILIYRKLYWLRDPELFRPWAYRIASREVIRQLKRRRRWPEQFDEDTRPKQFAAEPADAPGEELAGRLTELLSRVSPASRMVLVLHYLDEMPLQEVADVLGVPVGTTKSRLAYGLAALRREAGKLAV